MKSDMMKYKGYRASIGYDESDNIFCINPLLYPLSMFNIMKAAKIICMPIGENIKFNTASIIIYFLCLKNVRILI